MSVDIPIVQFQKIFVYLGMMETSMKKKIILVGDKVLVSPEKDQEKSTHGLYLPPGVKEKEKVQSGYIVKVGPGYPVVNPNYVDQEPWSTTPGSGPTPRPWAVWPAWPTP